MRPSHQMTCEIMVRKMMFNWTICDIRSSSKETICLRSRAVAIGTS